MSAPAPHIELASIRPGSDRRLPDRLLCIVEDNETNAKLLMRQLHPLGMAVHDEKRDSKVLELITVEIVGEDLSKVSSDSTLQLLTPCSALFGIFMDKASWSSGHWYEYVSWVASGVGCSPVVGHCYNRARAEAEAMKEHMRNVLASSSECIC
jgi:hypothetical protein